MKNLADYFPILKSIKERKEHEERDLSANSDFVQRVEVLCKILNAEIPPHTHPSQWPLFPLESLYKRIEVHEKKLELIKLTLEAILIGMSSAYVAGQSED